MGTVPRVSAVVTSVLALPIAHPAPVAILLLAGLTLLVVRRRSRARLLRWRPLAVALLVAGLLLTGAGAADAVNVWFGYLPRLGDVAAVPTWPHDADALSTPLEAHPAGVTTTLDVPVAGTGLTDRHVVVWLPPQYFTEPSRRFPVVYLLHGSPGVPADWLRGAEVARSALSLARAGRPVVVVIPRVSRGWLDDSECVDGAVTRVESYVVDRLVPAVDATLRTDARAAARAVGGNSAGGYCAVNLGLRHRGTFGAVIDLSGMAGPTHAYGMAALFGRRNDLGRVVAANSPLLYLPGLPEDPAQRVFMGAGSEERTVGAGMREVRTAMERRGVPVTWRTYPGAHTFHVWRPALADGLGWFAAGLELRRG